MALVQFPGGLVVPPVMPFQNATPVFSSLTIDAASERTAFVFTVPRTGTLERAEFRSGVVSLDAASKLKISFQDVDGSEDPDGTVDQYRLIDAADVDSISWIVPGAMTDDGTDTGNKRAVTRGQRLAMVLEYDTFTAADSMQLSSISTNSSSSWAMPSRMMLFTASSWSSVEAVPALALRYDDGSYFQIIGAYPVKALSTATFNNGSTPDEQGMVFQLPAPMLVGGCIIRMGGAAALSLPVVLYNGETGEILRQSSLAGFTGTGGRHYNLRFDSDVRLEANVPYILAAKPSSATNINLFYFEVNSSDLMAMMEGGVAWQYAERTNDGDWIFTANKRPWMSLWVTAVDHDISGGSGGSGDEGVP